MLRGELEGIELVDPAELDEVAVVVVCEVVEELTLLLEVVFVLLATTDVSVDVVWVVKD
jgi:hypothetical protein